MNFLMSKQERDAIILYLANRPYKEVNKLIDLMAKLEEIEVDPKKEAKDDKKV